MTEKVLRIGRILVEQKRGIDAIRYLYEGIKQDPMRVELYFCLGDALKQSLEYDLALKIYQKALFLAKKQGKEGLVEEIQEKIESLYLVSPEDVEKGPQIGFFIRSIMKMLSSLGKQDWF